MLKKSFLPAAIVSAIISLPFLPAQAAPTAGEIDGFSLYQTSTITGDKDVLISANAVKILDRKNGNGLIARAPDWKVYALNQRSRRICTYTAAKYPGSGKDIISITGGAPLNDLPLKRGTKATLSGTAAVSCETSKAFEAKQLKDLERAFAGPRFAKWAELMIADKGPMDKLPKQGKLIICRYYGISEFGGEGLPLRFKYVDLADQLHTLLLTNSIQAVKLPANTFDPPRDFTTVSDLSKLDDRPKIKDNGPVKAIEIIKKRNVH
ncbi:MAG: hypothetical protein JSS83_08850 [Cyanobacteria bacterium SZAS LIN-3]|nr:hypothetical protein [Cyanobacteria bacterium SZAS LIN-3]